MQHALFSEIHDGQHAGPLFQAKIKRASVHSRYRSGWARRQAELYRATPAWADQADIRAVWRACRKLTKETGTRFAVDHVVPLNSELVCGLNVVWNLRIIPYRDNHLKSNNWWPDMPEVQMEMF